METNGQPARQQPATTDQTLKLLARAMRDGTHRQPPSPQRAAMTERLLTVAAILPDAALAPLIDVMESIAEKRICHQMGRPDLVFEMPVTHRLVTDLEASMGLDQAHL